MASDVASSFKKRSISIADERSDVISDKQSIALPNTGRTLRRRSTLKSIGQTLTGLMSLRRQTLTKLKVEEVKPKVKQENTYKTEPDKGTEFGVKKITEAVYELLKEEIGDTVYSRDSCGPMSCDLACKIKERVKELNFPRYKIVCQVVVGQAKDQGIEAASRCVWNPTTDNYACVAYRNETILTVALIYGVYFD